MNLDILFLAPLILFLRVRARVTKLYEHEDRVKRFRNSFDPPGPYVSVIVPVLNAGSALLNRSLGSLRRQTLYNFEVIVIDDQSEDDSWEFILSQQKMDPRIRAYRNARRECTLFSRTVGVLRSRSDYVMWLDPDDEMLPTCIRDALFAAEDTGADIVDFQAWERPANGGIRPFWLMEPQYKRMNAAQIVAAFKRKKLSWTLWRKIFRRTVYLQGLEALGTDGYLPIVVAEDLLHFGAVCRFANLLVRLDKRLVIYYTGLDKKFQIGNVLEMKNNVSRILTRIYGSPMFQEGI